MIALLRRSQTVLKVTEKQWNLHAAKCFVVLCMQMMLTQTCSCLSDLYLLWFVVGKIESRSLACRCRRCTKLFVTTQFFYFGRLLKINLFSVTTIILFRNLHMRRLETHRFVAFEDIALAPTPP